MSLFITNAYAAGDAAVQATTGAATTAGIHPANSMMSTVLFLVVFIGLFYFLFIRPQNKRAKEHRSLLDSLGQGDEVVTGGGLMGKIQMIQENVVDLEIAQNVVIKIQRSSIVNVLPKGTIKSI